MKISIFCTIIGLLTIVSCKTNDNQTQEKVSFEIYETLTQREIPVNLIEEFRQMNIELNTDTFSPIIAYVPIDSTLLLSGVTNNVKFLQTVQPLNKDKKHLAIVAVKKNSDINTSDIKKTKANQNNIEIYFNFQGANKWANLTKNNIGKLMAFAIDNKIYALTHVNAEIKNGTAIINGLEDGDLAAKISMSINSSL